MRGYTDDCCSVYTKVTGISKFKKATTPILPDSAFDKADADVKGQLGVHSSKCTMKVLWLARLARPDVMKAYNDLTTKANNGTRNDYKRLYRIFCYLHTTRNHMLCGHIGDTVDKLFLRCFTDADMCADSWSTRSTSGGFLISSDPITFYPLAWICKKASVHQPIYHRSRNRLSCRILVL